MYTGVRLEIRANSQIISRMKYGIELAMLVNTQELISHPSAHMEIEDCPRREK